RLNIRIRCRHNRPRLIGFELPHQVQHAISSGCLAKFKRFVRRVRAPRSAEDTILRNRVSASCNVAFSQALSMVLRIEGTSLSRASTLPMYLDTNDNMSKLNRSFAAILLRGLMFLYIRC